jgi:hypothetical protein
MFRFKLIKVFVCLLLLASCGKDDPNPKPGLPVLAIEDISVPEGNSNRVIQVKITLDKVSTTNVVVRYSTKDGSAFAGRDYIGQSDQSITIAPGQMEALISITILGNTISEPDKYFEVIIINAINSVIGKQSGRVTILNDDEDGIGGLNVPQSGYISPLEYPGYELVWSDEFRGAQLNSDKWTHEIGTGNNGWGNNELQFYRSENTYIHNNEYLVIEARRENFGGRQFTSSRIITSEKASFKYGRVDIRAALPRSQGIWPALWMLGDSFWQRGWPSCGEIDIMEMLGHQPNKIYGTAHWGPNFNQRQFKEKSIFSGGGGNFHQQFHVFSIIWQEDRIEWYMNDQLFNTLTPLDMNGFDYPFNDSFFFIFNIAVGGNWPGNPDQTTLLPQHLIVDYIRVFQKI